MRRIKASMRLATPLDDGMQSAWLRRSCGCRIGMEILHRATGFGLAMLRVARRDRIHRLVPACVGRTARGAGHGRRRLPHRPQARQCNQRCANARGDAEKTRLRRVPRSRTATFAACAGRSTISVRMPRAPTWRWCSSPGTASRSRREPSAAGRRRRFVAERAEGIQPAARGSPRASRCLQKRADHARRVPQRPVRRRRWRGPWRSRWPGNKDVKPGLGRIGGAENTLFVFSAAPARRPPTAPAAIRRSRRRWRNISDRRAGNTLGADAGPAGGLRPFARQTTALCRKRPAETVLRLDLQ